MIIIRFIIKLYLTRITFIKVYRNNIIPLVNPTYEESTLVIPNTELSDQGWYICIATNEAGETRGETYLTVQELPVIVTPDVVAFQTGSNITIECRIIKGNPSPKLAWYRDNYPVQDTTRKRLEYRNSSLTLIIFNGVKEDEGNYKCDAVSPIGKASRDVQVIYKELPKISATNKDIKIKKGEDLVLECKASGSPVPDIYWNKDGRLIQSTPNKETVDNKLIVRKINISDSGNYMCTARNDIGDHNDVINVFVGTSPEILNLDRDRRIEIGKSDRLFCITSGRPKPTIYWTHNNKELNLNYADVNYIDIIDARLDDAGIYECHAENMFGKSVYSVTVTITGALPPIIKKTSTPEVIKLVTGDHVELSCPILQGTPKPNITWYVNNNLIDNAHINGYLLKKDSIVINQMTGRHVGEYECVATNPLGEDRKQLLLKLFEPPRIDKNIETIIEVLEGENVTLICDVTGDPTPLVIWSRLSGPYNYIMRGHKQDGTNNLYFSGVTAEDIGKYVCRAKNIAGVAKQDYALNVIVPPRIVKWPSDLEVEVRNVISLHCNVYSLPKASIKWLKDNETFSKPNSIYGPYLRFYAESSDRGVYSCLAENKAGHDRVDVNIIVLEPPVIDTLPPKVEILKGEELTINCKASGTPDPELVWYYQGQTVDSQEVSNRTSSLLIENATESTNGVYTCVATNKVGNTRHSVEVKILQPPQIKRWNSIEKVVPGEEVVISCEVSGDPQPYIVWLKDGKPLQQHYLENTNKIKFIAEREHSGEYSCKAFNKVGNDSVSLTLIILEPPIFAQHLPNSIDILLGEDADLPCVAFGDPKPNVLWSNIQEPQKVQEIRFIRFDNGTLKILNVTLADDGYYICRAENKAGSVERQIKLNILEKPEAHIFTKNTVVHEGEEIILNCDTKGKPRPKIHWMKTGDILYPTDEATLRITARAEDSGLYSCIAENIVGKSEDSINITVYVAPTIAGAKEESVIGLKGDDMVLTCQLQGIPQPTLTWIRNNTEVMYTRKHYRLLNDSLVMQNLTLSMSAMYTCEAKNLVGTSEKSFRVIVHARPEILNNIETNITLHEGDDYHLFCTVTGVPAPTVYWKKDQKRLFPEFNNEHTAIVENNTLVLADVTIDMSGIYRCIASNIHGETSKNYSILVVERSRLYRPDIVHVEINASDTGTLTCPLNDTEPVTKVIWLRDDQPLGSIMHERADDVHFSITNGKQLKIAEAFPEDTGNYSCIGIYPSRNVSSDFLVDVLITPQFIDEYPPEEYTVNNGDTLKIDCSANGHPPPRINWKYLDRNLPVTELTIPGVHFEGANKELLYIESVNAEHNGRYSCSAANKLGKEKRIFRVIVTD